VQGRIPCLIRDSLCVHGFDEALRLDSGELLLVHIEDVRVLAVPGAARIEFLQRNSGDAAQRAILVFVKRKEPEGFDAMTAHRSDSPCHRPTDREL